ncbi:DUF2178 domain-containing protein [Methanoregula sp. UBA64]|jgi:uncharacterized membrane protein|uniref:DUF2178 domain-containing protein n=1 Tax=Methanoregula sp. UBA64 TaxID=1915554 RepID=UPI002601179A|nr:DUF2178 domain-containing protein [Methanoregula sp. UBA64]
MKKNIFYLLIGFIAVLLLAVFWYSVENFTPIFSMVAFVLGVIVIYMAYRKVDDYIEDERSARITEKAALRTFQVFWVSFCAFSILAVMNLLYMPRFSREHFFERAPGTMPPEIMSPRMIGYIQLGLLCLMIFLYVGFRFYYAKKYGEWETDEE